MPNSNGGIQSQIPPPTASFVTEHAGAPAFSNKVSVIIKALNEQDKIEAAIVSALTALAGLDGEVILADSLSTDRTVEIASRYPIKIVQLLNKEDRNCGVGPQLGFQYARGDAIYLMDGDMELHPDFLRIALQRLKQEPDVGGIGGLVEEGNAINMEIQSRVAARRDHLQAGEVDRLNGGGLFRRRAIEDAGYFSNRNLHAYEEYELALRLRAKGWRMLRLPEIAARHYGHAIPGLHLLARRFRSGYAQGAGEILRAALGKPYLFSVIHEFRAFLVVIGGWIFFILSLFFIPWSLLPLVMLIALSLLAILVMIIRKRNISLGLYVIAAWNVFAAGTIIGFLRKPKNVLDSIPSKLL